MDATIRMKFEDLKVMHLREMENLMTELNAERHYRAEQCKKLFKQWYENLSVECILTTSSKIPAKILDDDEEQMSKHKS